MTLLQLVRGEWFDMYTDTIIYSGCTRSYTWEYPFANQPTKGVGQAIYGIHPMGAWAFWFLREEHVLRTQ